MRRGNGMHMLQKKKLKEVKFNNPIFDIEKVKYSWSNLVSAIASLV